MSWETGRRKILTSLVFVTAMCGSTFGAVNQAKFVWLSSNPSGAQGNETIAALHGQPDDFAVYDMHFGCQPGNGLLNFSVVTRSFGPYKPEALKGQEVKAVFVVDGKRVGERTLKLTAADFAGDEPITGIEAAGTFDEAGPLLDAIVAGKRVHVELPGIKSDNIALKGFAAVLKPLRKHCGI